MVGLPILHALVLLQRSAEFAAEAPLGTGLEWMTWSAVLLPAILIIVLVYVGSQNTV